MKLEPMRWESIPLSDFEIMTNMSGELFVRHKTSKAEIRISGKGSLGFHISDLNSPGKLSLYNGIDVSV